MLGDPQSARDELANLSAAARGHPEVLELEWSLHAQVNAWLDAVVVAQRLVESAPDREFGWIHRAYALRRSPNGTLPLAWDALRPAYDHFPKNPLIAYNLSCYAAQMDRIDEAWEWFQTALSVGNRDELLSMAMKDPDLAPLRSRISLAAKP